MEGRVYAVYVIFRKARQMWIGSGIGSVWQMHGKG